VRPSRTGRRPEKVNPLVPATSSSTTRCRSTPSARACSFEENVRIEFERNRERYRFLKWGQSASTTSASCPRRTGIVHQVNLEYLASVCSPVRRTATTVAYPDTLVGTDSHTTMINGLGVLGWGVGGIEAEAVMLGQPVYMLLPEVVGFELTGELPPGPRPPTSSSPSPRCSGQHGVVGKFVEFFGRAWRTMTLADRATIANMAPEYGATMGFFPVDAETLRYLRFSGRDEAQVELVERYCKAQGLFWTPDAPEPRYTDVR
jgi:aconitate hydratase